MRRFAIAALISLGAMAAVPAARANEALDPSVAHRLDGQSAAYSMTAAKRERLMIIQENLARQRHYEHRYGPPGPLWPAPLCSRLWLSAALLRSLVVGEGEVGGR